MLLKVNLVHDRTTTPITTVVYVQNIPLLRVKTHSSGLTFIPLKITRGDGRYVSNEYWFEIPETD